MTESIKLPRELAIDLQESEPWKHGQQAEPIDGYVFVAKQEGAEHRWYTDWTIVARRLSDGQLFESEPFEIGSTEHQENSFWECPRHKAEGVRFEPVVAHQTIITVYGPAAKSELIAGIDVRACAASVIETAQEDIDFLGVAEQHEDAWAHLSPEDQDRVHRRVYDLATSADLTTTWPEAS